jgi:hypothetical protein
MAKEAEKKYIINVSLGNDNEPVDQYINANGYEINIQRGKNITVPKTVLDVLDAAIVGVTQQDPSDPMKTITVDRKRFPYTVVGVV